MLYTTPLEFWTSNRPCTSVSFIEKRRRISTESGNVAIPCMGKSYKKRECGAVNQRKPSLDESSAVMYKWRLPSYLASVMSAPALVIPRSATRFYCLASPTHKHADMQPFHTSDLHHHRSHPRDGRLQRPLVLCSLLAPVLNPRSGHQDTQRGFPAQSHRACVVSRVFLF